MPRCKVSEHDWCSSCKHDKRIPDGAGITDGCHHRGAVLGLKFPECREPKCKKCIHDPGKAGYMHDADDDGQYDVDGVLYCGRCHHCVPCDGGKEKPNG